MTEETTRVLLITAAAAVLLGTAARAPAVTGHNALYNIDCKECHFQHSNTVAYVARGIEQESRCQTCHNPTGVASNKSDVAIHDIGTNTVPLTTNVVDCGSCHEVHNGGPDLAELVAYDDHSSQWITNIAYVRAESTYVPAATNPVIFYTNTYAFATNDAPWNGVCQGCHTKTLYHRNDNTTDNSHEFPGDCTTCHSHSSGFEGAGGSCLSCHNSAKDAGDGPPTRRAVVGEFGLASHHVADGTVTNEDCAVCHYEAWDEVNYHKNNMVDLINPDDTNVSALISFTNFTRNSSTDVLESWVTNVQFSFCLKCHDADGATQSYYTNGGSAMRPFTSGTTDVVNVFDQFNTTNGFHHAVRGPGANDYCVSSAANGDNITMSPPWNQGTTHDVISCFDCHEVGGHGGTYQRMLQFDIDFDTIATATNAVMLPSGSWSNIQAFCVSCHSNNVYVDDNKPLDFGSRFGDHPGGQSAHLGGGAANENRLSCFGCHAGGADVGGMTSGNGAAPGNIHGGSFTWPGTSFASGTNTEYFMVGGWLNGWMLDQDNKGKSQGNCRGGLCQHGGSTKSYGRE